jgi:amino acid transporter
VTKAMGPQLGWMAGWAIVVADVLVMANLAQIAGLYTFELFGWHAAAESTVAVTLVGVVWIILMTWIVLRGIELSARTQIGLLGAEIFTLALFSVVALVKVYSGSAPTGSIHPSLSWINPFSLSVSEISAGMLLAVFIYWGWDTTATVNEETEDPGEAPGKATVIATLILLAIYVVVAFAAQAYDGVDALVKNQEDVLSSLGTAVFGSPLDKLLIIAVLTSAAASTQTTILPTARTTLSMARAKALPGSLGKIHPRYLTPHYSTLWMGGLSIVWYVGLTIVSEDILFDSLAALGLMIAFYIGITGFATTIYYRREVMKSVKNFFFLGVGPTLGGAASRRSSRQASSRARRRRPGRPESPSRWPRSSSDTTARPAAKRRSTRRWDWRRRSATRSPWSSVTRPPGSGAVRSPTTRRRSRSSARASSARPANRRRGRASRSASSSSRNGESRR